MLDRIHLFVPFLPEFVDLLNVEGRHDPVHVVRGGLEGLGAAGVRLSASSVVVDPVTLEKTCEDLRHPWESLSTGFTPMAVKVFHESMGKRAMPGVELKASPAKLLQGHNVFGPTDIALGAAEMWRWLAVAYPGLTKMLDLEHAEVYDIDCTFSARLPDQRTALQAIEAIRGVSNGQTKGRGDDYQTTAYFGAKDSRLRKLKLYLKHPEFLRQLEEAKNARAGNLSAARTAKVLSDPRLDSWASCLLRIEATVAKRWLNRRGIPNTLIGLCEYQQTLKEKGICLIEWCWREVTRELFAAFEGMTMRVINDETVLNALIEKHTKRGKDRLTKEKIIDGVLFPSIVIPGKSSDSHARSLFRTYRSIKEYGWQETMDSMSRASFYRHVSDICECGISKAALQKLKDQDRKNNVVPLLRFLDVDFSAQRPNWYIEPQFAA